MRLLIEKNIFNQLDFKTFKNKFDIIFIDPPYKEKKLALLLDKIILSDIMKNEGIMIIHRHKKEEDKFPEKFKIIEEKIYGLAKIIFGRYV